MWLVYSLLSAFFAALTALLSKIGVSGISSNLATGIRTLVVLLVTWAIVLYKGEAKAITQIPKHPLLFLVLSGIATGLSWLFYFKALQIGELSKVAPIDKLSVALTLVFAMVFLHENINWKTIVGTVMIIGGVMVVSK